MSSYAMRLAALLTPAFISACAVGPDYERPSAPVSAEYKEVQGWKPATPGEVTNGAWWAMYDDPVLDALAKQVEISNQNLKAAEAAYRAAREQVGIERGQLLPAITGNTSVTQSRGQTSAGASIPGSNKSRRRVEASLQGDWQIDLWGRIRRSVESSLFAAQASAADLAAARLSAQGELASAYFQLRAAEEQKRRLEATVQALEESLEIAKNRYAVGVAALSDVLTAQTQLGNAQAELISTELTRARLEHAIAVLVGKPPAELALEPAALTADVPVVPAGIPSALLERRPDVAAAERRMGEANAQVGVAVSAWFPNITLSGMYGFASNAFSSLFNASNAIWAFGPALAQTIFDGGAREAQIALARANFDQSVANYRQTVLTALQQVEDQLAALRILERQAKVQDQTVKDARLAEQIALNQYRAGITDYTTVVTAQTTRFNAERAAIDVQSQRLQASAGLVVALGGGWETSQVPEPGFFYSLPETPPKAGEPKS
ncbi:MAG: efflux transporter outer membrane subunit [Alphaproteobacteria bacterium]